MWIALLALNLAAAPLPSGPGGSQVIALPGGSPAVDMDYLAADRSGGRVWVPAGNTGQVDVIAVATGGVQPVPGFATAEREMRGKKRVVGPSSVTIGDGVAFVGSRADASVCAIDAKTLVKLSCVTLETPPDGVCWVQATRELWVTAPRKDALVVIDASKAAALKKVAELPLPGGPEGYAVDNTKGLFFTNLEDKDQTLAFDVKTRKQVSQWASGCGANGPRGLAVDDGEQVLFVACTDRVISEDLQAGGKPINQLITGAGVDNIDFLASEHRLYAAAGKAEKLSVARSAHGVMTLERTLDSAPGGRVVVVDAQGAAYVADSANGRVLRYPPSP